MYKVFFELPQPLAKGDIFCPGPPLDFGRGKACSSGFETKLYLENGQMMHYFRLKMIPLLALNVTKMGRTQKMG